MSWLILLGCASLAHADPRPAPCLRDQPFEFVLSGAEFQLSAYDAKRGVLAVKLPTVLPGGDGKPALRSEEQGARILLPVDPEGLAVGLDEGLEGFELKVLIAPADGPQGEEPDSPCGHVRVAALELLRSGLAVAKGTYPQGEVPAVHQLSNVRINVFSGRVDLPKIEAECRRIATDCLRRGGPENTMAQGALSIEVGKTVVEEVEEPRIVVDGLMHARLSRCLLETLTTSKLFWKALSPGTRAYLNFYFRRGTPSQGHGIQP